MSRTEDLARKYWVDALIALLAIAGALELVVGRNGPSDPPTDLGVSMLLLAVLVAPIFARRQFPFAGPAAYWVLAAAITYYDGELIAFVGSLGLASALILLLIDPVGLQPWIAALLVGAVLAIAGWVMLQRGLKNLKRTDPTPRRTVETIKDDIQWAKEQRS